MSDAQRDEWLLKTEPLKGARPRRENDGRPPVIIDQMGVAGRHHWLNPRGPQQHIFNPDLCTAISRCIRATVYSNTFTGDQPSLSRSGPTSLGGRPKKTNPVGPVGPYITRGPVGSYRMLSPCNSVSYPDQPVADGPVGPYVARATVGSYEMLSPCNSDSDPDQPVADGPVGLGCCTWPCGLVRDAIPV